MPEAFVVVGSHVRLDRAGLAAPAPRTVENLLRLCGEWAAEVGWSLGADLRTADAIIVGPGIAPPPVPTPVVPVRPGQGLDGFRWAIRHAAFSAQWPARLLRYGARPDHVVDVRQAESPRGLALLLHGGFWLDAWRRDVMDGLAIDLVRRGWTTWNVEYRRVGNGGGWPATAKDVVAAVDAASSAMADAAEPLVLVGHSAGAQLALWAASERREQVSRVVALAGLCDLESASRHGLGGGAVDRFLEGEPADVASPMDRLPVGVPLVLAHAVDDLVVPIDQTRRFAAAAAQAGDEVVVIEVEGSDHMSLVDPAATWQQVVSHL
jgi:acetyl esterase/lipase